MSAAPQRRTAKRRPALLNQASAYFRLAAKAGAEVTVTEEEVTHPLDTTAAAPRPIYGDPPLDAALALIHAAFNHLSALDRCEEAAEAQHALGVARRHLDSYAAGQRTKHRPLRPRYSVSTVEGP